MVREWLNSSDAFYIAFSLLAIWGLVSGVMVGGLILVSKSVKKSAFGETQQAQAQT